LELSSEQISSIVSGYTSGTVPDYQMSAFLMAVVCRGMTMRETVALTSAMLATGGKLDLSSISGIKLDKHSTGGVGDKVSLAFVPIIAAAGIPIAKMSGRGLGHTGGTLDKLQSIDGFRVELSAREIIAQLRDVGGCICAQTSEIAPADKEMYALRDVTGTVDSIPLIASSIMSKKIAGGADVILLDVKVGCGAFMKTLEDAEKLANVMTSIGQEFGKQVIVELTSMDVPLGRAVGNLIEVNEVRDLLRGNPVDQRLKDLVLALSDTALTAVSSSWTASELIANGSAAKKFSEIIAAQGGSDSAIDRWNTVQPIATVTSPTAGYVADLDAEAVGRAAMLLGAGRETKADHVDPLAGIWLEKGIGEYVEASASLARLYGNRAVVTPEFLGKVQKLFVISNEPKVMPPTVLNRMNMSEQI
jgi:pyrimidine-nucleoside phosphorylase